MPDLEICCIFCWAPGSPVSRGNCKLNTVDQTLVVPQPGSDGGTNNTPSTSLVLPHPKLTTAAYSLAVRISNFLSRDLCPG